MNKSLKVPLLLLLVLTSLVIAATTEKSWQIVSTALTRRMMTNETASGVVDLLGLTGATTNAWAVTNVLGSGAYANSSDFQPADSDLTNWAGTAVSSMATLAGLQHGTNHLNGSAVETGTVVPARMGTNFVLVAGDRITLTTNYSSGVHTVTATARAWDVDTTITVVGPNVSNLWSSSIAVDTVLVVESLVIGSNSDKNFWTLFSRDVFGRTNGGTWSYNDAASPVTDNPLMAARDFNSPSDGTITFAISSGGDATYKWRFLLRTNLIVNP